VKTLEVEVRLPRLHPGQEQVLAETRRYNVLACGRRWGKTTLLVDLAVNAALDGKRVGWFAPTYALLEEAYGRMRRTLEGVITQAAQSPHPRLELYTGGAIEFWTLDDPYKAGRGRAYHLAIVDEAAFAKRLDVAWEESVGPTLTDYRGSAWFASTPKGKNYFFELWSRGQGDDPDWKSWRMPTSTNPHISAEELAARRRSMPELAWRQEYEAEFVDAEGAVIRREWIRVADPPERKALEVYQGVDLAISTREDADYTAVVTVGKDKEGRIWVLDAVRTRETFHRVLELIKSQAARWQPRVIAIEQVQYQAAVVQELLRTTALPVRGVRPDRDKLARAMPLIARYEQGLVYHAPALPKAFEEELTAFPLAEHDDQVDALVYAYQASAGGWGLKPETQRRYAVR